MYTSMPHAIDFLICGHKKFQEHYFDKGNDLYNTLAQGQKPKVLLIACSDSRVDPALVTNCKPGDLFVVRNVANLVPHHEEGLGHHGTSAALEFGICTLQIRHVVVFGHTQCGGIIHLLEKKKNQAEPESFLSTWMDLAQSARDKTLHEHSLLPIKEKAILCSQYSLQESLKNLMTFPWIKERVLEKNLFLHAWQFNIETGCILNLDSETDQFVPLSANMIPKDNI